MKEESKMHHLALLFRFENVSRWGFPASVSSSLFGYGQATASFASSFQVYNGLEAASAQSLPARDSRGFADDVKIGVHHVQVHCKVIALCPA